MQPWQATHGSLICTSRLPAGSAASMRLLSFPGGACLAWFFFLSSRSTCFSLGSSAAAQKRANGLPSAFWLLPAAVEQIPIEPRTRIRCLLRRLVLPSPFFLANTVGFLSGVSAASWLLGRRGMRCVCGRWWRQSKKLFLGTEDPDLSVGSELLSWANGTHTYLGHFARLPSISGYAVVSSVNQIMKSFGLG